jgi:hypothetical protein
MRNTADVTDNKPIAVFLQSISGAFNPLVAFYNIHGGKREVHIFYFGGWVLKRGFLGGISDIPLLHLRGLSVSGIYVFMCVSGNPYPNISS